MALALPDCSTTRAIAVGEAVRRYWTRVESGEIPRPDLVVIDGGIGQLRAARGSLDAVSTQPVEAIGLAKREEEIFVADIDDPIILPRDSQALYLMQRIRDEAHRFANTFHGELRGKRMTKSVLDGIPGLGEHRKKRLVAELGGVNKVKAASLADLESITWLPDSVARAIHDTLHPPTDASSTSTVEVPKP